MKITTAKIIRWAGLSAIVAGLCYVIVGLFHPLETLATVTTPQWLIVHALAVALSFFGVLGITGLYARQVQESGWLGLIGYVLLILWLVLLVPFTFTEVVILPGLVTQDPAFVESFLGVFNGHPGELNLGAAKMLYDLDGAVYLLGALLFGIATIRAGILSRWPAGLLAVAAVVTPLGALLPHEYKALVAVPVGIALAWLGYALWAERRAQVTQAALGTQNAEFRQAVAK